MFCTSLGEHCIIFSNPYSEAKPFPHQHGLFVFYHVSTKSIAVKNIPGISKLSRSSSGCLVNKKSLS